MSFSKSIKDNFGKIFEQSPFLIKEAITDISWVQKGNNIVVGRKLSNENYDNLLYLGKVQEKGGIRNYLNADVYLDTTFPHVIYITGTRGTGKSFDLGVLIEGISALSHPSNIQNNVEPITSILIDTQDQFWTLGNDPSGRKNPKFQEQIAELDKWKIKPNSLKNLKLFSPPVTEKFVPGQQTLTIRPTDVSVDDWCALFEQEVYSPQGHVISETLDALKSVNYGITDIVSYISDESNWPNTQEATRNALLYRFSDYERSGLFDPNGIKIEDLMTKNHCHVLMLRELSDADKALVTAIIARNLFKKMGKFHTKMKRDEFFEKKVDRESLPHKIWLFIDEAHVVAPKNKASPARPVLTEYVKRGRDAGLSLVLATQQPAAIDNQILSQVNVSINHRLILEDDITAATNRIPSTPVSEMTFNGETIKSFGQMIRRLEAGTSFLSDSHTSRSFLVKIRPRTTAHGGFSPV